MRKDRSSSVAYRVARPDGLRGEMDEIAEPGSSRKRTCVKRRLKEQMNEFKGAFKVPR